MVRLVKTFLRSVVQELNAVFRSFRKLQALYEVSKPYKRVLWGLGFIM